MEFGLALYYKLGGGWMGEKGGNTNNLVDSRPLSSSSSCFDFMAAAKCERGG